MSSDDPRAEGVAMNQFSLPPICKACGRSLDAGEFAHVNCKPAEQPPEVPAEAKAPDEPTT